MNYIGMRKIRDRSYLRLYVKLAIIVELVVKIVLKNGQNNTKISKVPGSNKIVWKLFFSEEVLGLK